MEKTGKILIGLAMVAWLAAAGCAQGSYARSRPGESRGSYTNDVPPAFYDNDPALRQWYTAPYWNPGGEY
jgi:hypothetical protein